MSKSKRRTMKVSIPAVNMSILRGDRKMDEQKTAIERRRENIEDLDLEAEELKAEAKVTRTRREVDKLTRGEESPQERSRDSDLGNRLIDEVLIPMVAERVRGPDKGASKGDSVALEALRLLKDEREKGGSGQPKSPVSMVTEVISVIKEVRGLVEDKDTLDRLEKMQKSIEDIEEGKKKGDPVDEFDRMVAFVDKVKTTFNIQGSGDAGSTAALIEQQRWQTEYDSDERTRDRAFNLRLRQMDRKHDLDLAKLNVEKERTAMFDGTLKRLGDIFVEAVVDDEGFDEGSKAKLQGKEIVQIPCPECDVMLTIPPEAQHPGAIVVCPKCKFKSEVTGE